MYIGWQAIQAKFLGAFTLELQSPFLPTALAPHNIIKWKI